MKFDGEYPEPTQEDLDRVGTGPLRANWHQDQSKWKWDNRKEKAAVLLARGKFTHEQICEMIGVAHRTLDAWKKRPQFRFRIEQVKERYRQAVQDKSIAIVQNRIDRANKTWHDLQTIIKERGKNPKMKSVPGGKTGLLIPNHKSLKVGMGYKIVVEYEVDADTLAELRALEKQAAQELGQWIEKKEEKTPDGAAEARKIQHEHLHHLALRELAEVYHQALASPGSSPIESETDGSGTGDEP